MLKPILVTLISVLSINISSAQKRDSTVYYLNKEGRTVASKEVADFKMVFLSPDSAVDKSLYIIKGYYKDGHIKLIGYSKTNDIDLKFEGKVTVYFPNGHKMRITNYTHGKMIGDITEFYPDGTFYNREKIVQTPGKDDKTLMMDCSDFNGKVLAKDGKGTWLKLNGELTKVVSEGPIVNGVEEGEWRSKKVDSVETINEYKNGKIVSSASLYKSGAKIYSYLEKAPEFPGGADGFSKFIANNVRYPAVAKKDSVQGKVLVSFVVEKDGSLSDMKITKGIGSGCDEEAIRVMKLSPKWEPGVHDGKPVRVAFSVPIVFSLKKQNSK